MKLQKIDKKWWFFGAAILAQFLVMFFWVLKSDYTLHNGTVYKFRLRGYDPYDPFRGKYLRIQFKENIMNVYEESLVMAHKKEVYASFSVDNEGFAVPVAISKSKSEASLKVEIVYLEVDSLSNEQHKIQIYYPFDKVWMNQEECPVAERIINNALNKNQNVYALVSIKNGDGVLIDVEVDGISIKTLVKEEKKRANDGEYILEIDSITIDSVAIADSAVAD